MDYRLVPYIKKYLHEGHSLDQIRQSLLSQGIPDADIKQAAVYAMDEGGKEIKKKISFMWAIPVILILLIIGAGYYFRDPINVFATETMDRFTQSGKEPAQDPQQGNTPQYAPNNAAVCDMDCLIASAENCQGANIDFDAEMDFFGMIISSTTHYELRPGNKCSLYIKSIDADIEFSQELRDHSLANGISEEELELQLQESRKNAKANMGKEGICVFDDTMKLKEFLEKTKAGTFDAEVSCSLEGECTYGGDWELGKCTGTMFSG